MLGRRNPQRDLFEADVWPNRVAADSIYGRMAAVRHVLFNDDGRNGLQRLDGHGQPVVKSGKDVGGPNYEEGGSGVDSVYANQRDQQRKQGAEIA